MNERIKKHLEAKYGASVCDEDLYDILDGEKVVWTGDREEHRWWDTFTQVVEVDGMFIAFEAASTTGDESAENKGWEFDPAAVVECEPKEVRTVTTIYVPKQ